MYNNKFFATQAEARAFKKEHGGAIYSATPKSKTKRKYCTEMSVAFDARMEVVNPNETPWCVAWNEK